MDEADRMIDMGFEEDVRTIFSFFKVGNIMQKTMSMFRTQLNGWRILGSHLYHKHLSLEI